MNLACCIPDTSPPPLSPPVRGAASVSAPAQPHTCTLFPSSLLPTQASFPNTQQVVPSTTVLGERRTYPEASAAWPVSPSAVGSLPPAVRPDLSWTHPAPSSLGSLAVAVTVLGVRSLQIRSVCGCGFLHLGPHVRALLGEAHLISSPPPGNSQNVTCFLALGALVMI